MKVGFGDEERMVGHGGCAAMGGVCEEVLHVCVTQLCVNVIYFSWS